MSSNKNGKKKSSFRFLPVITVGISLLLALKIANLVGFVIDHKENFEVVKKAYSEAANKQDTSSDLPKEALEYENIENFPRVVNNKIGEEYSKISENELLVLEQLAERRELIEAREKELDQRMALLEAAEKQLNTKIDQLKKIQKSIEEMANKVTKEDQGKVDDLVNIYSNMKPKDAARIFNDMEMDILTMVFSKMKQQKSAAILSAMSAKKANALTVELAKPRKLPF